MKPAVRSSRRAGRRRLTAPVLHPAASFVKPTSRAWRVGRLGDEPVLLSSRKGMLCEETEGYNVHAQSRAPNGIPTAVMYPSSSHDRHILIIEDDPAVREDIVETLSDAGFRVCAVDNGTSALALLAGNPSLPVLIFLDLRMPETDGWTFRRLQRAYHRLSSIPTAVITGAGQSAISAPTPGLFRCSRSR
jgi:CheY-like chemotaxis protein